MERPEGRQVLGDLFGPLDILRGILGVEHPLDAAPDRVHHLGGAACPQGEDAVQLLHDVNIIQPLGSGYAPAHVFKAARHILLAIEIVRRESGGAEGGVGIVQHPGHVLRRGDGQTLQQDAAALFQAQGEPISSSLLLDSTLFSSSIKYTTSPSF